MGGGVNLLVQKPNKIQKELKKLFFFDYALANCFSIISFLPFLVFFGGRPLSLSLSLSLSLCCASALWHRIKHPPPPQNTNVQGRAIHTYKIKKNCNNNNTTNTTTRRRNLLWKGGIKMAEHLQQQFHAQPQDDERSLLEKQELQQQQAFASNFSQSRSSIAGTGEEEQSEEDKYWAAVKDNPSDFTAWSYLLQLADQKVCPSWWLIN